MADFSHTNAGNVIDANLEDAKAELKKTVQRLLIQNLKRQHDEPRKDGKQLVRVNSVGSVVPHVENRNHLSSDAEIARYLKDRGYEYTLSVLMAESNVPDSNVLKSIATSLRDSRSKLLLGSPDFQAAILRIWDDTERKYNEKLRQYVIDWEMKQTMQFKQMENVLQRRMAEEEREAKRQVSIRMAQLEEKERDLTNSFRDKLTALEQEINDSKTQLLSETRALDEKRHEIQSLENEFQRQVDVEQNRIRIVKDNLNQLSLELKRQQLQLTFQMDEAIKEAKRQEQLRYTEKLQQLSQKETKIRGIIEKAKTSRDQVDALKIMLGERDSKIQDLEISIQQYKNELIKLEEKLQNKDEAVRKIADYELLKIENGRLRDEARLLKDHLTKEKLQLQQRNYDLEAKCRELTMKLEEWIPSDENPFKKELMQLEREFEKTSAEWKINENYYRKQLDEEKSKNDHLKQRLDQQTDRLHSLVEEMKKLQFQVSKKRILNETDTYGERFLRGQRPGGSSFVTYFDDIGDMDEDAMPDYLKEAKRRLRLLERETETFEESVRRYQQKSIDSSSMALWQAQATASTLVNRRPRNDQDDFEDAPYGGSIQILSAHRVSASLMNNPIAANIGVQPQASQEGKSVTVSALSTQSQIVDQPTAASHSDQDDWEARLRKREEERTRRDEELRKKNEEEMRKSTLETNEQVQKMVITKDSTVTFPQQSVPQAVAPAVDPVLQKYMQMVLEQRTKEKEIPAGVEKDSTATTNERVPDQKKESLSIPAGKLKEQEVEVGAVEKVSSDSDFEW